MVARRRPTWPPRRPTARTVVDLVTGLLLAALVCVPRPGRVSFDTKLDLLLSPADFLERALTMWNPGSGLGELQNQAFGYLFPIGPFFAAGEAVGLPDVAVQRGWQALVLVLGYLGARRLLAACGVDLLGAAWVGALAYALCPRMLTTLGALSAEALAVSLLPWIILPLVQWRQWGPRRAAALSACGVLALGGANATVTLAVLVVPVLWLLTRPPEPGRRRLAAWWVTCTAFACLWWFLPLVVLGRYSPPFLDLIETAHNTSSGITAFDALRGTTHWVAGFTRPTGPWWPAGFDLLTEPVLVGATAAVAAFGLAGLCVARLPERRFWVLTALAGLTLLALGSEAVGSTPLADGWRWLLDGPLVPFRNIHKFDPVLRLPLAVGTAWAVQSLVQRERVWVARRSLVAVAPAVAVLVVVAALVALCVPVAAGRLRPTPDWQAVPDYWQETADYLAETAGPGTSPEPSALLVPSSGFGEYTWGRTIDEPLQALASSPWVVRKQFALGAVGLPRLLDSVEQSLAAGRPAPGLAELLARSGIDRLVVRNDLDWAATGSPRPAVVHAVLDSTPGLRRAATFGPPTTALKASPGQIAGYALDPSYPAVEVYDVMPDQLGVRAVPLDDVAVLSGGPESVLPALASGVLDVDRPVVLAGDDPVPGLGAWVLTDGLRRRERNVGRVQGNLSATMARDADARIERRATDLQSFDPSGHQTVAQLRGVVAVTATTSAGFADALDPIRPEYAPAAALDGNIFTSWRSSQAGTPVGEALTVELVKATDLRGTSVVLENNVLLGPRVTRVEVVTDTGRAFTDIPASGAAELEIPAGDTRTITVRVDRADGSTGRVGVAELSMPDVSATASLRLPRDVSGSLDRAESGVAAVVLHDDTAAHRACVPVGERPELVRCDPGLARGSEEQAGLDRVFDLAGSGRYRLGAAVIPASGTALSRYLEPFGDGLVAVGSSVLDDSVAVRAGAAVDGDPATAWVSAPGDTAPTVSLQWPQERTVSRLTVRPSTQTLAARPQRLRLSTPERSWEVELDLGSTARFPPVTTDELTVRVLAWERVRSFDPVNGLTYDVPPGIAELELDGGVDSFVHTPDMSTEVGALCGTGPTLVVDGRPVQTQVSASVGDIVTGLAVDVTPCDTDALALATGRHHVRVEPTTEWDVTAVSLVREAGPGRPAAGPVAAGRAIDATGWGSSRRAVAVGAGPESLLVVPEGENPGWRARLDGEELVPQTVDGWQQGWVVPAGEAGTLVLEYSPQRWHVAGLIAGGVLATVVLLLGLWPGRSPSTTAGAVGGSPRLRTRHRTLSRQQAFGGTGTPWWQRLPWLVAGAVPVLLGGVVGVVAVVLAAVLARWRGRAVGVATLCLVAGGLVALSQAGRGGAEDVDAVVQALVLTAFGVAWWSTGRDIDQADEAVEPQLASEPAAEAGGARST